MFVCTKTFIAKLRKMPSAAAPGEIPSSAPTAPELTPSSANSSGCAKKPADVSMRSGAWCIWCTMRQKMSERCWARWSQYPTKSTARKNTKPPATVPSEPRSSSAWPWRASVTAAAAPVMMTPEAANPSRPIAHQPRIDGSARSGQSRSAMKKIRKVAGMRTGISVVIVPPLGRRADLRNSVPDDEGPANGQIDR
jgi:hypothetical protein